MGKAVSMNTDTYISWGHTVGAALVSILVFFVLLYFVAPIAESLLDLHGRVFVPGRLGGGSEVDNPGIITLGFRAMFVSGLSALGALLAGEMIFAEAYRRPVIVVFSGVVIIWAVLLAYFGIASGEVLLPLITVCLGAAPPIAVAYWLWKVVD